MKVPVWIAKSGEVADLARFKELLLRTCGHSFENEREQALSAGLCRRMAARGIDEHNVYLSLLMRDSEELHRLTELLTVNETYFFREPDHLNLMIDKLLPEFMNAANQTPVRILSAGCSTGEEPYSIAILLRERYGAVSERLFTITAVDIDSIAIATAKQGLYGKSSFRGMSQALLERYFEPGEADKFRVSDTIRKQVGFEVVNLLGAAYPQKMQLPDIILYRNVSIYFPGQVQREIFGKLAELLVEGGCLLVGASETIHHDIGILSLIRKDSLFYYQKTPKLVFEERRASSRYVTTYERTPGSMQATPVVAARPDTHQNRPNNQEHHARQLNCKEQFDTAIELAHNKQYDKALAALDAIIALDAAFEKAYCLKGRLLLGTSRFDEARSVCEGILQRDPLCLEAYLMLGMIARQNEDVEGALKRFREALYLDSSCWPAHFYSAEILLAQRETKRAQSAFETVLRILGNGSIKEHGQAYFPISFNAEQFIVICRHKLSLPAPPMDKR
jgi:chemotaxis protein methyltransferase CheR